MYLLKKDNFEFTKILANGYEIVEDEPNVNATKTMANGSIRRNYGFMPKTNIKIKFSRLSKEEFEEYMSYFEKDEDVFEYYSPKNGTYLEKKFFIQKPTNNISYIDDDNADYEEFEIQLQQIDEVE